MKITENYIFFWDGIYSQWYEAPMQINGVLYNCCEQYMMHQKALYFGDKNTAEKIMLTSHPKDQKQLGREVKGFEKFKWDKVCLGIVYEGNLAKFLQNPDLKKELLATTDRLLVEASPVDFIWGIGMHEKDKGVEDPLNWQGTNLLGWAITLVKKEILSQELNKSV
jgi:ribA/ribD-fused uncharacterized protein